MDFLVYNPNSPQKQQPPKLLDHLEYSVGVLSALVTTTVQGIQWLRDCGRIKRREGSSVLRVPLAHDGGK